jgi:hypothetical protein
MPKIKRFSRKNEALAQRSSMKEPPKNHKRTLEHKYRNLFSPVSLPYHGLYTDEDSLEQPSALRVCPMTTTPGVEVDVPPQARLHAQLERNIR